jgi:hypothetical protein
MLHIRLVGFYDASALFEGFSDLWQQFIESDPSFSWGSNNHSLITVRDVLNHMDNVGIEYDKAFVDKCGLIDEHFYVDLEN